MARCPQGQVCGSRSRHLGPPHEVGAVRADKFEEQSEAALIDLINKKRAGKPITPKERPHGENGVDLMEALHRSVGGAAAETKAPKKSAKSRERRRPARRRC